MMSFYKKKKKKKTIIYLITGIIGIIIIISIVNYFSLKKDIPKQNQPTNEDKNEEQDNCPYNESELTQKPSKISVSSKMTMSQESLQKWRKIPRVNIVKLWKKGYHWNDILQLWNWKIPENDIPDLTSQERIGVINNLSYRFSLEKNDSSIPKEEREKMPYTAGNVNSLVVIVRKTSSGGLKINLDEGIETSFLEDKSNTRKYCEKLISFVLKQENINSQQYEISLLNALETKHFGKEYKMANGRTHGKSFGSAIYLALLSALHQKPISKKVTATGTIAIGEKRVKTATFQDREEEMQKEIDKTEQELHGTKTNAPDQTKAIRRLEKELQELKQKEINLKNQIEQEKKTYPPVKGEEIKINSGTNLPIYGLKEKTSAAYEDGVNILVLSKYNSAPNLLLLKKKNQEESFEWYLSQDYQLEVPPEIKEKIKVFWTENIKELKDLIIQGKLS